MNINTDFPSKDTLAIIEGSKIAKRIGLDYKDSRKSLEDVRELGDKEVKFLVEKLLSDLRVMSGHIMGQHKIIKAQELQIKVLKGER